VAVHDLRGAPVRVLHGGSLAAGVHALRWDGRDGRGREVAAGVYWVRVTDGESRATAKLVLAR
jgi:flagellar hook assembly protein FlgD